MRIRLLLLVAISFLFSIPIIAQDTEPDIPPTLQQQIDGIEIAMESLRGLSLQEPLTRVFPNRDDLLQYLITLLDEEFPPEVAEREMLFYRALGFLSPDVDLRAIYLDLYHDQVAGFYDVDAETMNVVLLTGDTFGSVLPFLEQVTYAHEFVHALQDQNFDLAGYFEDLEATRITNPDALLAFSALVEGDATLAMSQYMTARMEENPVMVLAQLVLQQMQLGNLDLPEGTPDILRQELFFPYETGLSFVSTLYNRGGWEMVNAAFTDKLPQSTEQILHPERYFSGDMPHTVTLPDYGTEGYELDEPWQNALERTVGEFYLRLFLANQLTSSQAAEAAEGWGGDLLRIYQHDETGDIAWVWRIVWDSFEDTQEFAAAYTEWAQSRFPTPLNSPCWVGDNEASCIIVEEDVTVISYAPNLEMAQTLAFIVGN
ncbi:MAG: hypothetical protein D6712_06235 [Chloroflexi bacterium]|nr:MAG: hypothetical protein D6712_06235 [Chloroflexota bacterium]